MSRHLPIGLPPDYRKKKDRYLRRTYGITYRYWMRLQTFQGYACAICRNVPKRGWQRLSVDHNHKTGLVRGLLCFRCNRGLAYWRDRADNIARAAEYLRLTPVMLMEKKVAGTNA